MDYGQKALSLHEKAKGKIEIRSKVPVNNRDDLSTAYTPGVAEPCRKIHQNPEDAYRYTARGNLVAVVSDGSAVLGQIGKASTPANSLNRMDFPSMTGMAARGPMFPSPNTADPSETTATRLPRAV